MPSSSDDHSDHSPADVSDEEIAHGSEDASSAGPESPTDSARTTCANCGHTFTGNYCPNCGQEAGRSVTIDDVAGSFARELADVEGGLWTTFKGLTLRPGDTLRAYLGGAQAQFISPGRYLLISILVSLGVVRGLIWLGGLKRLPNTYAGSDKTGGIDAVRALMELTGQATRSQWWTTGITLVSVVLLALILRRMFREEMREWAVALAASAFLSGHAVLLSSVAVLLHALGVSVATGQPTDFLIASVYSFSIAALYVGAAVYDFSLDWTNAVKGGSEQSGLALRPDSFGACS